MQSQKIVQVKKSAQQQPQPQQSPITTVCLHKYESKILYMIRSCTDYLIYLTESYLTIFNIDDISKKQFPNSQRWFNQKAVIKIQMDGASVLRMVVKNTEDDEYLQANVGSKVNSNKDREKDISKEKNLQNAYFNKNAVGIAILYKSGVLQIRDLSGEVKRRFTEIEIGDCSNPKWPQMYWNYDDIYILSQHKLQLISIKQKQRKVYSELIPAGESKNLLGLIQSHYLQRQRILILPFINSINFNIIPIPITTLTLQAEITKFLSFRIMEPKSRIHSKNYVRKFDQYIIIVLRNKILRVYSVFNMKIIFQIIYDTNEHEIIETALDWKHEYLHVYFLTKKNKVTKNLLYKINQNYKGHFVNKNHQHHNQPSDMQRNQKNGIFLYQVKLELRQKVHLISGVDLSNGEQMINIVSFGHIRHYTKRCKGEVLSSVIFVNEDLAKNVAIENCKYHDQSWKELREWKEIIASYLQMKNTLDKIDVKYGNSQKIDALDAKQKKQLKQAKQLRQKIGKIPLTHPSPQPQPSPQPSLNQTQSANKQKSLNQPSASNSVSAKNSTSSSLLSQFKPTPIIDLAAFDAENQRIKKEYEQSTLLIQEQQRQMQKQMQKYQRLKFSLIDGANKFKDKIIQEQHEKEHHGNEGRIQEQFYKFMAEYLKQNNLDIDTDILFETQTIQKNSKVDRLCITIEQPQPKNELLLQSLYCTPSPKPQNKSKQKKKNEKPIIPQSKSSERLTKDTNNLTYLNRTKSNTKQEFESNFINKTADCNSLMSSLSDAKLEVVTKSQQNIESHVQSESQDQYIDNLTSKIAQSIQKAFQPFEKRLDNLQAYIARTQSIHVHHLKTFAKASTNHNSYIESVDMRINGYCQQLLQQFDKNLQEGLKSYWTRIQQTDKKASRERDKCIGSFGLFIDQQIKSREQIFDSSRILVENSLAHLRKKIGKVLDFGQEESQEQEQQMEDNWMFKKLMKEDYGFGPDIEQNEEEEWKNQQNR